jgi:hypothetical protein
MIYNVTRLESVRSAGARSRLSERIPIDVLRLEGFCRRWMISELAAFGSVLREDFRPESDLDVLATFESGAEWSLLDHVAMQEELSGIVGRPVDLIGRRAVERSSNGIRRRAILETAEPLYAPR